MRRVGTWNEYDEVSGGDGNDGVSGNGRGFDGEGRLRRGSSFGSLFFRFGIVVGGCCVAIFFLIQSKHFSRYTSRVKMLMVAS